MATPSEQELFEGLKWKLDNNDIKNKKDLDVVESLCEWFEDKRFFTPKQMEFGKDLLGRI